MAGWDIGKLVIFVKDASLSGQRLYDILREEYHLQMEMAAGNYVLAIMTVMDTKEGWQRLADALTEIDGRIEEEEAERCLWQNNTVCCNGVRAQVKMKPSVAFHRAYEEIRLEKSDGRIVAGFINLYPPGIPLLVPGEVMNASILCIIRESMHMGLNVQGITREGNIEVVVEDRCQN